MQGNPSVYAIGSKVLVKDFTCKKRKDFRWFGPYYTRGYWKGTYLLQEESSIKKKSMVLASTYYLLVQCIHDKRMPCRGCIGLRWRLCMYAIRRLLPNFQSTIIVCAYVRVTRTYTRIDLHVHAHTYTHRTHTLTRVLEKSRAFG